MKHFIKIVFGSCLGVFLAFIGIGLILSLFASSKIAQSTSSVDVKANSVLKLSFDKLIPERTNNTEAAMYNFSDDKYLGLSTIAKTIKEAKEDRNIKGIYLSLSNTSLGQANAHYIRQALKDFKASGKFIHAYCGNYGFGQGGYFLATVADQIIIHPLGSVDLRGFGTEMPFFKDMLDKLGIKMNVFYAGKFKSATEPVRLNEMSDENRLQIKEYLNELYGLFVSEIAEGRGMSSAEIERSINELDGRNAQLALENGLVDKIQFEDEVFDDIRKELDFEKDEDLSFVTIEDYHASKNWPLNLGADSKIAVVYAEGEIRSGDDQYGMITDDHYVSILRKIRKDKKVKAVVLRVNSPGGDAFVSDEIWRETQLIRENGVPVVASFGNVAASGGYYIACGADKIVAEPSSITGSIGVFGMIPNMEELMNDKLGIHWDTVRTAKYANGLVSPFQKVGHEEAAIIQSEVDRMYDTFLGRVALGRNMTRDAVHEVAQGRVWTGNKAKELGLIDELGSIDLAIDQAKELAGIEGDDYRISEYPKIKDPVMKLIEDITGNKVSGPLAKKILSQQYPNTHALFSQLEYIMECQKPMARLPFDVSQLN